MQMPGRLHSAVSGGQTVAKGSLSCSEVERGIVQNTAMYSERYLPACKSRPITHICRPTVNWTPENSAFFSSQATKSADRAQSGTIPAGEFRYLLQRYNIVVSDLQVRSRISFLRPFSRVRAKTCKKTAEEHRAPLQNCLVGTRCLIVAPRSGRG